ncbi:MAG: YetF domain-containing protein [bacterium]
MHPFASIDWHEALVPTVSLLELILRGSAVYLFIFVLMRFLRRQAGGLSTADLLLVVLVADAAQNAMAAEYHSVPEGLVLVATLFAWNYAVDWVTFRFPRMHKLLNRAPLPLVEHGRVLRRNLRKEFLTTDDLHEMLREQGVDDLQEVKRCCLEGNGRLSVIKRTGGDSPPPHPAHPGA